MATEVASWALSRKKQNSNPRSFNLFLKIRLETFLSHEPIKEILSLRYKTKGINLTLPTSTLPIENKYDLRIILYQRLLLYIIMSFLSVAL